VIIHLYIINNKYTTWDIQPKTQTICSPAPSEVTDLENGEPAMKIYIRQIEKPTFSWSFLI